MKIKLLTSLSILAFSMGLMAQTYHVNEDFNSGSLPAGWTNTAVTGSAAWSFGLDGSVDHSGNNNLDGTSFAYFDDSNLGGSSTNNMGEIVTPAFDNSANGATFLEFDYNFRHFGATVPDSFYVEVFDGTNWNVVFSRDYDDCGSYVAFTCTNNFPHANIDISAYKNSACQVRFVYFDGNDWGWYVGVDNVVISSPLADDIGVTALLGPKSSCGLTTTELIEVRIYNYGANSATGFPVSYMINGGTSVTETVSASIPGGDSLDYTFTTTANLSGLGVYNVDAYTSYVLDGASTNDSINGTVENYQVFQPTYFEGFDAGLGGWQISGNNSSWAVGAPAGTKISASAGGTGSLVTNLSGVYNTNELSYVTSPCLDFSALTADPFISFSLNYETENSFDKFWLEYSTDDGATWAKIPSNTNSVNWYSNTSTNVWTGSNSGWAKSESTIPASAGQSKVKVRFVFSSDGGANFEGVGIDNFTIKGQLPIDIEVVSLDGPVPSNLCGYGPTELVTMTVLNKGTTPITTFDAGYRVNGGAAVLQNGVTPPNPIAPNATYQFTFAQTANMQATANYVLDVWAKTAGDGFAPNDSLLNAPAINIAGTIFLTPFTEDFENFPVGNGNVTLASGWETNPISTGTFNFGWRPNIGTTPSNSNTGPNGDHTTGNGKYLYLETSGSGAGPLAYLESPCIDLTNVNGAVLSFWYHKFGADMNDLFVDVYNGSSWINNIGVVRGETHTSSAEPWQEAFVSFSQFAGKRIKFRFRGLYGGGFLGDMAIDDLLLYEPLPQDAKTDSLISPESGCDLTPNELLCVNIENFGTQDITSIKVGYSINNGPPVYDSAVGILIIPGAKLQYCFNTQRADLSAPGNYDFKIWTDLNGDTNIGNDTLYQTVVNETILFPDCEDFEGLTDVVGEGGNDLFEGKFSNNWIANQGEYTWEFGSRTSGPGPNNDHSPTGLGRYMVVDNNNGQNVAEAIFTSPCYDLTTVAVANLEFWYHTSGSTNNRMYIDVFDGQLWQFNVDSVIGNSNAWTLKRVSLANYTGNFVNVRFRAYRLGGTYTLDDICVVPPPPNQAQMVNILRPVDDLCFYSTSEPVRVRMKNIGSNSIDSLEVQIVVDTNIGNSTTNFAPYFDSTIWVYPGANPPTWDPGDLYIYETPFGIDMSRYKTYRFRAQLILNGDLDVNDDVISNYRVTHNEPIRFPYKEGFESLPHCNVNGPVYNPIRFVRSVGDYEWEVKCGPSVIGLTGPARDHTRKNNTGKYFVTNASLGDIADVATLETSCLDMALLNKPSFRFWYHMFGFQMGVLYVDINADNGWVTLDSILGQQQINNTSPWLQRTIDLSAYAGTYAKFRFRSLRGDGGASNMAIDDLFVYDLSQYDIGPTDVVVPGSDNFSCYSANQEVHVELLNYGSKALDFKVDTMRVEVEILKDGLPWDTLFREVNANIYPSNTNPGTMDKLPSDSSIVLWVNNSSDGNSTFDMSAVGSVFTFNVTTEMKRDSVDNNDDHTENITAQIAGGSVSVDNNSICNGTIVRLNATGFFGAPKWERKYFGPGGTSFWLPEFNFGSDSAEYVVQPDTSAWYRVRICGSDVVSDSVFVSVTVVKTPDPIHDTICGGGNMTVEAFADPIHNLQAVNWYHNQNDTAPFFVSTSVPFTHTDYFLETDTFWMEGVIDSCISLSRNPVYAVVNPYPVVDLGLANDTLCMDTNKVLNAGAGVGYTYAWEITAPNGAITTSDLQAIGVNPLDLSKDSTYKYEVVVTSQFGCVTLSNTVSVHITDSCFVGISDQQLEERITLYPNPTDDIVYLKMEDQISNEINIEVLSMDGKVVWSKNRIRLNNSKYKIDLGRLAEGIYFVKVNTEEGFVIKKLVKN